MITDVVLPQMGLEVAEGVVLALPVEVGQTVAEGDVIAEVETDKAIAEVPASRSGVIVAIEVALEDTIPIGTVIVRIADSADEVAAPTGSSPRTSHAEPRRGRRRSGHGALDATEHRPTARAARLRAAPIARRAAESHGIDLQLVTGTGPSGRITLGDIERVVAERDESPAEPQTPVAVTPQPSGGGRLETLSPTRQSIARRLTESQLVPQYTLTREFDAGWLLAEKARLTAAGPIKVGVLDLLLVGLAETVSRHRQLAASFVPARDGEPPAYRHPEGIDLGIAVATDRGLLVPVIRGAEARSVSELVLERSRLVDLTRVGPPRPGRHGRRRGDPLQPRHLRRRPVQRDAEPGGERDPRRRPRGRAPRPARARYRRRADDLPHLHLRPPGRRRRRRCRRALRARRPPRRGDRVAELSERVGGTALVVGGSSGIGRACVESLAASGWPTAVFDLKPEPGEDAIALDVRDREAVFAAVAELVAAKGPLGTVVYAAGTARVTPILEVEPKEWELVLGVNLTGAFHALQASAPHIAKGGSFTAISSIDSQNPVPGLAPYCASKAGVEALVRSAALELGPAGVRANAVLPGLVRTPLMEAQLRPARGRRGLPRPDAAPRHRRRRRDRRRRRLPRLARGALDHRRLDPGRRRHGPDRAPEARLTSRTPLPTPA